MTGPDDLLEPHHEVEPFVLVSVAEVVREPEQQHVLQEIEDGLVDGRDFSVLPGRRPARCTGVSRSFTCEGMDVRPVDREAGDHLHDRAPEAVQREIPGVTVLLRQVVQVAPERVHLAGHGHLHNQLLLFVDDVLEIDLPVNELFVDAVKGLCVLAVDEDAVHRVQEHVARGAEDGPVRGHALALGQDLLAHDVKGLVIRPGGPVVLVLFCEFALRQRRAWPLRADRNRSACPVPDGRSSPSGAGENTAAGRKARRDGPPGGRSRCRPDQPEDERMGRLKDLRVLHADGAQAVDVEEPAVIDLLSGHAPVREAVDLLVHELVQEIEALRIAFCPVETAGYSFQVRPELGAGMIQGVQPPLDDLLFAVPLLDALRYRFRGTREDASARLRCSEARPYARCLRPGGPAAPAGGA